MEEGSRLEWQGVLRAYYRATGDISAYLMPPAIILSESIPADTWIDIGIGIFRLGDALINIKGLWCISTSCPLPGGLYVSSASSAPDWDFPDLPIKIKAIAEAETDGEIFRVIRSRPLKRDIGKKPGTWSI